MASEGARARETLKYYQPWLDHSHNPQSSTLFGPNVRSTIHVPQSSRDKALIAFAQLATLRLNVKRATVTLIDTSRQYILAEATRTLSLVSDARHAPGDDIWFGNASIPRGDGVSGHTLNPPMYTAKDPDGASYTTAALVVPDTTRDPRFKHHGFVGRGIVFYAGVPIKSRAGHNIGAYSVTDPEPRHGLTVDELMFLQDMAITTLEHLETIKGGTDRYRGEQMVLGLGSFIEGLSTSKTRPRPNLDDNPDLPTHMTPESDTMEHQMVGLNSSDPNHTEHESTRWPGWDIVRAVPGIHLATEDSTKLFPSSQNDPLAQNISAIQPIPEEFDSFPRDLQPAHLPSPSTADPSLSQSGSVSLDPVESGIAQPSALPKDCKRIFARAANILRESTAADGVIFFDASSMDLREEVAMGLDELGDTHQAEEVLTGSSSEDLTQRMQFLSPGVRRPLVSHKSPEPYRLSDHYGTETATLTIKKCPVLGLSVPLSGTPAEHHVSPEHLVMDDRDLRRCIQRYPRGKVFAFSDEDSTSSSDEKTITHQLQPGRQREEGVGGPKASRANKKKGVDGRMSRHLLQVIPGARNVVFWPLWDLNKERWAAGGFIWTTRSDRLLNAQDDLSYLRAFGNSIMSEVARQYALTDVRAKSMFISSISHELRSPLHGILGGIEFLQDTAIDSFQSGMITSIEICGKTLLDTVDHLLDYAKLNNLTTKDRLLKGRSYFKSSAAVLSGKGMGISADFDIATVVEEAVEAVHAGMSFRSHVTVVLDDPGAMVSPPPETLSTVDASAAPSASVEQDRKVVWEKVALILDIEKQTRCIVTSQAGAIRRVVMNLVGNALKYTDKGFVQVSLRVRGQVKPSSSLLKVHLLVSDSGKGMSYGFLRNHAFSPFTQEDSFADGTGLGLSVVRQIVDSLGGSIDVQSQKGVGTNVSVSLNLPIAQTKLQPSDLARDVYVDVGRKTEGLVLGILDPTSAALGPVEGPKDSDSRTRVEASLKALAEGWFGMKVMRAPTMDRIVADFYIYVEAPSIDYLLENHSKNKIGDDLPLLIMCTDSLEASAFRTRGKPRLAGLNSMVEVFSQPCGPQKLSRALRRYLLTENTDASLFPGRSDAQVHHGYGGVNNGVERTSSPSTLQIPVTLREDLPRSESRWDPESSKEDIAPIRERRRTRPPFYYRKSHMPETETVATDRSKPTLRPAPVSDGYKSTWNDDLDSENSPFILIVDDNQINLQLLVALMKKFQFPFHPAANGLDALEAYKKADGKYKYILMDIQMPVMDGLCSTREIRKFEKQRGIPSATVIALTGLASASIQQDAYSSGVDHFLAKPVRFQDLKALLGR